MTSLLYGIIYACALVFAAGCILRALRYARMPLHLRWELYPVPHEAPERAAHGGSYFEQLDWWTQPRDSNFLGEIVAMLAEIVLLKGVWAHNRKLWFRSFPFHFGLYLLAATAGLLALSALLNLVAPTAMPGSFGVGLHYLYAFTGVLGVVLAIAGAAGLLFRRLTDSEVKVYTTPGDVFNLLAFVVTLGLLGAGYLLRPSTLSLRGIAEGILRFDTALEIPGLLAAGLVMAALLAAYIPMTQMSHFIGKYFTYHSVRWDDRPNLRDGALERKVAECVRYRPTWSAAHIGADGSKTWADIATTNPAQQVKK
ncbi:MAG: respiratory nitrate reductase subunit gamma [Bryobacteraceae bacterium]|jgi:nitrate reductase gamma subunit